ncbi:MAG: hemerythrin domain-containing protein, partial [Pseudomonadota bacterium]
DLVEAELQAVDAGQTPDLELLHDIMQYMIIYSDAIHHPREDLLYREMRDYDSALADGLDLVETDHQAIAELGIALRNDISAMMSGVEIRRERVLKDTNDYVQKLRGHMEWEEEDLFKRADTMAGNDNRRVDLSAVSIMDPVFGEVTHSVFENLRRHLERASAS